jgi:hypothetical protein
VIDQAMDLTLEVLGGSPRCPDPGRGGSWPTGLVANLGMQRRTQAAVFGSEISNAQSAGAMTRA